MMDDFTQEIRQITVVMVIAFLSVAASAAYWAITGESDILTRPDNPRTFEAEAAIQRGSIYDNSGELLVETVSDDNSLARRYLHPEMNNALGYFSLRYGVGGAEAAYDDILRGDTIPNINTYFSTEILHQPQMGSDVRLTFDHELQGQIVDMMGDTHGTVVLLDVSNGNVLSLVSLPTYDPNILDSTWDDLIAAEGNPFFNRALQGRYQAGGTLQTPLMAVASLTETDFAATIETATESIELDNLTLGCTNEPSTTTMTLAEAYAYGCPSAFLQIIESTSANTLNGVVEAFQLDRPPALTGFIADIPEATITPNAEAETDIVADLLGQGAIRVNPMGMATLMTAILNGGNAPQPHALDAVRAPQGDWLTIPPTSQSIPYMTTSTARRLRDLMIQNVNILNIVSEDESTVLGGHIALAYSGDSTQTWFVGFASTGNNQGYAIALVLEDEDNPMIAADKGMRSLQAALAQANNQPDE